MALADLTCARAPACDVRSEARNVFVLRRPLVCRPAHGIPGTAAGIFSSGSVRSALWSRDLHRLHKGNAYSMMSSVETDARTGSEWTDPCSLCLLCEAASP